MNLVQLAAFIVITLVVTPSLVAQDLLNDDISYSGLTLELQEYTRLPPGGTSILSMTTQPTRDDRLFITTTNGRVYAVEEGPENEAVLWFDLANAVKEVTGRRINLTNGQHGGLRSLAFHPEFATNGKLYTSLVEDRPENLLEHNYLGSSVNSDLVDADTVVVEWTYDFDRGIVKSSSYRELFRVNMPFYDHPIKQMKFDRFAEPGDDNYGLLYITHGDASVQSAIAGGGQNGDDALGKVLRIDPLQSGDQPYTTPASHFTNDDNVLNEVFALGFRNPHNLSFAKDPAGASRLLIADIGRDNIEEINIVEAGADHGWSSREGTFVHRNSGGGSINGVSELPQNEAEFGYTFPVAQFDHDAPPGKDFAGVAIAGAHVIDNGSELDGEYIFGDFGSSGRIFHVNFDEMLDAVTLLDPTDPLRDEPHELTQAPISLAKLSLDNDRDPTTPPLDFDLFTELLDAGRSDFRFGEGKRRELYISTKRTGAVYLVTNSLPAIGDLNGDRTIDAVDIDLAMQDIHGSSMQSALDMNRDGIVNEEDSRVLVEQIVGTHFGDANLDGEVAFDDFLILSDRFGQSGGWADGDFNGDGEVSFPDFLVLSANFGATAIQSVPEPSTAQPWIVILVAALNCMRRKSRTACP